MLAALTGAGLSASAGLNAFIPLLIVSVFSRFTTFIELPAHLAWLESWQAIIITSAFLAAELILDKIPGVDHVNDLIQSAIRPLVGGVIFAATSSAQVVDESIFWQENPVLAGILGAIVAAIVHTAKATSRPAINASTGGTGAPLASFAEDATAVALSFVAVFLPVFVLVFFVALGIAFYRVITTGRRRRRRRSERAKQTREEREALAAEKGKSAWWRIRGKHPEV
jgi:uncharacterized membrane protein